MPLAGFAPAAGEEDLATSGEGLCPSRVFGFVTLPTLQAAFVIAALACARVLPASFGTVQEGGGGGSGGVSPGGITTTGGVGIAELFV